ncbi:hypothetical protein BBP40_003059 [Aspergillus hancockii]|nr:hypothetical protein BBP40_003059 [Aspergillus hancockii]
MADTARRGRQNGRASRSQRGRNLGCQGFSARGEEHTREEVQNSQDDKKAVHTNTQRRRRSRYRAIKRGNAKSNSSQFAHTAMKTSNAPRQDYASDTSKKLSDLPTSQRSPTRDIVTSVAIGPKEENTNSRRPLGPPLAAKTDAKWPKADYPTQISKILYTQYATKAIVSSQEAQNNTPSVAVKNVSPLSQLARPASFLRLPQEIRWQIYQYLFEPRRVEILRLKEKTAVPSKTSHYRLYHKLQQARNLFTQAMLLYGEDATLLFNLVFTCQTIYSETILLLYSTTQFIFNSTNSMVRFLKTTSKDTQAAIQHVELNHIMYNEPRLTAFRPYKIRSDIAWYNVCDDMAEAFSSLKVLHVKIAIYDWPIRLEVGELWSMPLLLFGHHNGGLDFVNIQLQMRRFKNERLQTVARALEQKMMKPRMFQIREDGRLAKELAGPIKAKSVLRLVF